MLKNETPGTVLFISPQEWYTLPRLVKEIDLFCKSNYEPLIISTRLTYVPQERVKNRLSFIPQNKLHWVTPIDKLREKAKVYNVRFFVTPIEIIKESSLFLKFFFIGFYFFSVMSYILFMFVLTLIICITKKVRLIQAHNPPDLTCLIAMLVSKITGIPYVLDIQDITPELFGEKMGSLNSIYFSLLWKLEYLVISGSVRTVFIGKAMRDYVLSKVYPLTPSRCLVIHSTNRTNFLDMFKYDVDELAQLKRAHDLEGKFIILFLGWLDRIKGVDTLVHSVKYLVKTRKLRNLKVILVGDGEVRKDLTALVKNLNLDEYVLMLGFLPKAEAYKWLRLADVAVVPFKRVPAYEIAAPEKLFEYMAAGKAIIASDLPGLREVLRDGYHGVFFKAEDPVDLAEKIGDLMNKMSQSDLERLGRNAKKDFEDIYSWENEEAKLLEMYRGLLDHFYYSSLKPRVGKDIQLASSMNLTCRR